MINAFVLLLAERPYEEVKEEVLAEAMLRPTNQNGSYEKKKELTRRKRTVKRVIYRRAEDFNAFLNRSTSRDNGGLCST